jgi:hypothetical protein
MEHRCGARYSTEVLVYVGETTGSLVAPGVMSDISLSGCFIHTRLPSSLLVRVNLRLLEPYRSPARLKLEGRIMRRTPAGLGIQWSESLPELFRRLSWYPPNFALFNSAG